MKLFPQYEEVLSADPAVVEAEYSLATIYNNLHKWDEAVNCYKNVVAKDPANAEAYYCLGSLYKKQQKYDMAMDAFTSAVQVDEAFSQAHYHLSLLYFIDGEFEEARKHAESAQKDYPQAHKLLSLIDEETKESKG